MQFFIELANHRKAFTYLFPSLYLVMRDFPSSIPNFIKNLILNPEVCLDKKSIPFKHIQELYDRMIGVLESRPNILDLKTISPHFTNVIIVGDLRGEIKSTRKILQPFLDEQADSLCFLGDYVDEGLPSLINLLYIWALVAVWPDRVALLRGNHEDISYNDNYGFLDTLRELYPKSNDFTTLQTMLATFYSHLSLVALTPQESVCLHGGLPLGVRDLEVFSQIPKPHSLLETLPINANSEKLKRAFMEIRWNDPSSNATSGSQNKSYHRYYFYGEEEVRHFLQNIKMKRIIRSHETQRGAFAILFNGQLLHVLSYKSETSRAMTMGYYAGTMQMGYIIHELPDVTTVLLDLDGNKARKINSPEI